MQERTPSAGTLRPVDATRAHTDRVALLPLAAAVIVAAAIVGWLVLINRPATPANVAVGPVLVSAGQLTSASHSLGRPIYWAGPRDDSSYELTVTAGGRAYVRYLPRGATAGDSRADFLTVGTYPGTQAYENLKKVSTGPAVHSNLLDDGGLLVAPKRLPKSVYLAYPDADFQVEVYDSVSGAARRLALNGLIKHVR
jgi:hypothetical protein